MDFFSCHAEVSDFSVSDISTIPLDSTHETIYFRWKVSNTITRLALVKYLYLIFTIEWFNWSNVYISAHECRIALINVTLKFLSTNVLHWQILHTWINHILDSWSLLNVLPNQITEYHQLTIKKKKVTAMTITMRMTTAATTAATTPPMTTTKMLPSEDGFTFLRF